MFLLFTFFFGRVFYVIVLIFRKFEKQDLKSFRISPIIHDMNPNKAPAASSNRSPFLKAMMLGFSCNDPQGSEGQKVPTNRYTDFFTDKSYDVRLRLKAMM